MAFRTIQVVIDPDEVYQPDKRFWKFALFNEDGTPYSPPGGGDGTGINGASAYEIAVANGFSGTQQQWLASLVGAPGTPGADGSDGTPGADGSDGTPGADGSDGLSAYDIWKAQPGNGSGTVADYLAAIKGAKGDKGDTGDQGPATAGVLAPDWAPNTAYLANQLVRAPDLSLVRANSNFTSGAVYNPANWTKLLLSSGFVGYQETGSPQPNVGSRTDITGLALPTFTVLANEAIWIEAFCPYFTATAAGAQAAINLTRNEDSSIHSTVFSGQAPVVNGQCSELITKWRITAPGDYTVRAQVQRVGTGTITVNSSAGGPSYIRAYREQ